MKKKRKSFKFDIKKHWPYLVLAAILLLGLFVRLYHVDYPVIGYHNMKEAHTLMEARHFLEEGNLLQNRRDYKITEDNPDGVHSDNFPLYGWLIALIWQFTGVNVAAARIFTILLALGIIVFTYLITKELFDREDIAIFSSFITAVLPIFVFFGRMVFYDVPALLLSLAAMYFFLLWKINFSRKFFTIFVIAITLAALTKLVYLIFLFPMLAVLPYRKIFSKKFIKKNYSQYLIALILPVSYLLFGLLSNNSRATGFIGRMLRPEQIAKVTSGSFWHRIYMFAITDNFTMIGFILIIIGLLISIFMIKNEANRFLAVWVLSIIPYAFVIGWMLEGHSYYQFPFVPAAGILMAYALLFLTNTLLSMFSLKKRMKNSISIALVVLFFLAFMMPAFSESAKRQFDTQFYGLDTAGEFLRQESKADVNVFGSGHQDTGFYWHADRKGRELPMDVKEIKKLENKVNFEWIFLYQWGFAKAKNNAKVWEHITSNYEPAQIGLIQQGNQHSLYYMLLKKGDGFNESRINDYINPNNLEETNYDLTRGKVTLITSSQT